MILSKKIEFYQKQISLFDFDLIKRNSIVTYFIYENINYEDLRLLEIFCELHINLNPNLDITIFTNISTLKDNLNFKSVRLYIYKINIFDKKFIDTRTIINYLLTIYFSKNKYICFFDFDILPLCSYEEIFSVKTVGLTYYPEWKTVNKFPFNGGFQILNLSNTKNIQKFNDYFIKIYEKVITNQKNYYSIIKIENHRQGDLSSWWGDQFSYLELLNGIKIPEFKNDFEINFKGVEYKFFHQQVYNNAPFKLKLFEKYDEQLMTYIERISSYTKLIHLTGHKRKKHMEQIYQFVKNKFNLI